MRGVAPGGAAARRGLLLRLRHTLAWSARTARRSVTDREERRVVTVVFADVAGSTALGERIDAEELRALQGELFALVSAEVERFGGLSEKFVGDAVLAVFGVPLAHDDDDERAVRALETGDASEAHRCLVNMLWATQGFSPRLELEGIVHDLRVLLADVPAAEDLDSYFELSYAVLVDVPAGRWERVDAIRHPPVWRTGEMVWHELRGGMALRRGELEAASEPLGELRVRALESGEPQRLLPMASVVLPYAALTDDRATFATSPRPSSRSRIATGDSSR